MLHPLYPQTHTTRTNPFKCWGVDVGSLVNTTNVATKL